MVCNNKKILIPLLFLVVTLGMPCISRAETKSPQVEALSLQEVTSLALQNNLDIQIAKYDLYIRRYNLDISRSIFDTYFTAEGNFTKDTRDVSSVFAGTENYGKQINLQLEKKFTTGTEATLSATNDRNSTNSTFVTVDPEDDASVKFKVVQPLGRNFFGLQDRNDVTLTKLDIQHFTLQSLDSIEQNLADIQKAYWKLVLTYAELSIEQGILAQAKDLYRRYQAKLKTGLVEEPDLIAAKANVRLRENEITVAHFNITQAHNELMFLLNENPELVTVEPSDSLETTETDVYDFPQELKTAISYRRDYKAMLNLLEQNRIDTISKKNSLWPEIDLEASLDRNGIGREYSDAWDRFASKTHHEIFAGITIRTPLERREEKAQLKQAQLTKIKYLQALKQTEQNIFKEINTIVAQINSSATRVQTDSEIVELQRAKLKAEEQRLQYGRSSSDIIIRYQEDVLNAQLQYVRAIYDYLVSQVELNQKKNTLLDKAFEENI